VATPDAAPRDRETVGPGDARGSTRRSRMRFAVPLVVLLVVIAGGSAFILVNQARTRRPPVAHTKLPERPPAPEFPVLTWGRSIPGHAGAVSALAFRRDGARLVTAGADGAVKEWDARSGEGIRTLPGHTDRVAGLRATQDGRFVLTAGDHTVHIWSLRDGAPVRTIDVGAGPVQSLDVSPDAKLVAVGAPNGEARVFSPDGERVATLAYGTKRVLSVAFSPDGALVAAAGDEGPIKVWNVGDWQVYRTLPGHAAPVSQVVFAPNGTLLASASDDHTVRVWQVQDAALVSTLVEHMHAVWALAFSPDGDTLVSGGKDSLLVVWSSRNGSVKQRWPLDGSRSTFGMTLSADGVSLAVGYGTGATDVFRVAKARTHSPVPIANVRAHSPIPESATPELRTCAEAMDVLDNFQGDPKLLDPARNAVDALFRANPRSPLALAGSARVTFVAARNAAGRFDAEALAKSFDLTSEAIAADPNLPDSYCTRAAAALERGDIAAARTAAGTARRLAPDMARALYVSIAFAMKYGDPDEGEAMIQDMLRRPVTKHDAVGAFRWLGWLYRAEGDSAAEEVADRRLVEIDPGSPWAKWNLATLLLDKHDFDGAIAAAKESLAQKSLGATKRTLADAYCAAGEELLWGRGDAAGAQRHFKDALAADPTYSRAAYDEGAFCQFDSSTKSRVSSFREAVRWYKKAVALDESSAIARRALVALEE